MIIDDLFAIEYGQKEYHNKEFLTESDNGNILISSKGTDNGIYGFFDIPVKYTSPIITVPGYGTIGQAFVQTRPCAVDDHLLILIPKRRMSIEELYQIAYQIRGTKWKYRYGRGITPERLKTQKIVLCNISKQYSNYIENRQYTVINKIDSLKNITKLVFFPLSKIVDIRKKTALPQNAINLEGNIPYVTTTSKDNGVSNFTDEIANFQGNCLTVAMNGSVCSVFYQAIEFITSGDNAVLYLKNHYHNLSKKSQISLLLYIGSIIKNEKWRYNYYRKLSKTKLSEINIPVLLNEKQEIDVKFIENLVKNIFIDEINF